jgi:aquaporin Z
MPTVALPGPVTAPAVVTNPWPLYAIEAALLGVFMISACAVTTVLEHPGSPLHPLIPSAFGRRATTGLAMSLTAIALIHSKWGRRSGAHMNPAFTVSFLRLNKIQPRDAIFYVMAQLVGGAAGVGLCAALLGPGVRHPAVNYAVTVPGSAGVAGAWLGEFLIALVLMSTVLLLNRRPALGRFTGHAAAMLVGIYITFEAPYSGMSLNPARTLASAAWANVWTSVWIYFTAPLAGMLIAVEAQLFLGHHPHMLCLRLTHCPRTPSLVRCNCASAHGISDLTLNRGLHAHPTRL